MNFYVVAFIFASQMKKETPHLSYCKVNVYIFRRSNSLIIFTSLLGSELFKERICSWWNKFFLLRVDNSVEGL